MSLAAPKVKAPAPAPAPLAVGADALQLGNPADDELLNGRLPGGSGRLKLRVGRAMATANAVAKATAATSAVSNLAVGSGYTAPAAAEAAPSGPGTKGTGGTRGTAQQ